MDLLCAYDKNLSAIRHSMGKKLVSVAGSDIRLIDKFVRSCRNHLALSGASHTSLCRA